MCSRTHRPSDCLRRFTTTNVEPAFGRPVMLARRVRFPPSRRDIRRRSHGQPARQRRSVVTRLATPHPSPQHPLRTAHPGGKSHRPRTRCSRCSPVIPGPGPRFPSLRLGRSRSRPRRRLRENEIPHRFAGLKDISSSRPPRSRGFQFPEHRGTLSPPDILFAQGRYRSPVALLGIPTR